MCSWWRDVSSYLQWFDSDRVFFSPPLLGFNIHTKPLKFQLYLSNCIYIKFDFYYFDFYLFWFWCFFKKCFFNFIPQHFILFIYCVKLDLHSFNYYFFCHLLIFFKFCPSTFYFILFCLQFRSLFFLLIFCLSFSSFILFFNLIPHYFLSMIFCIRICPHCLDFYFFIIENFASLSFVVSIS
jgi:hypothetical protein